MTTLYTVAEIIAATVAQPRNITAVEIGGISIDSREIAEGDLFVAIKGERFDGHEFVLQALQNGAAAALISESFADRFKDQKALVVPDALEGLIAIARAARARSRAKIIAVTGSAGKTTTKEAIAEVLATAGKTHASIKSFNNHWGVPLMLSRLPRDAAFGVFELGMSAAEEIRPLSKLVQPHIAVITTIAPAHLASFSGLDGIAHAKAEIFDGLVQGGQAVINIDHDMADILKADLKSRPDVQLTSYGFAQGADVSLSDPHPVAGGMRASLAVKGQSYTLEIGAQGRHRLANAAAAFTVADLCGVPPEQTLQRLKTLAEPDGGRGAATRLGPQEKPLVLIDESYNANPASMRAALDVVGGLDPSGGKKIVVLGDMLELGSTSPQLHLSLSDTILSAQIDSVFLIGENMGALRTALDGKLQVAAFASASDAADAVLKQLDYGDLIMVKGSNSMKLAMIADRIRTQFA